MDEITTLGIDLAKRVFALHAVNAAGQVVLRGMCRRDELVRIVAQLPPWLMAPKFVRPYRKTGKNDFNDA